MPAAPEGATPGPSGRQLVLEDASARVRAVVVEVGGGLRELVVDGTPVLDGYGPDERCAGGRGQILAPWPNRLEDGRYEFGGVGATAALDEPEHHNAIHGLVRWLRWSLERVEPGVARATCRLAAQPGYPWGLELTATYRVPAAPGAGAWLEVDFHARNTGEVAATAPFGLGMHPYLHAGPGGVDAAALGVPATRRLLADERGLPRGEDEVGGGPYDFGTPRAIGELRLDTCFTGLQPVGDTWTVSLQRGDGMLLTLSAEARAFPYVMCYSGDTLPVPQRRRALAVEPMSCPPNALRSREAIVALEPGGRWSGGFRLGGAITGP